MGTVVATVKKWDSDPQIIYVTHIKFLIRLHSYSRKIPKSELKNILVKNRSFDWLQH